MKKAILCLAIIMAIYVALPVMAAESQDDIIAPLNKGGTESPVKSVEGIFGVILTFVKWVYTAFFVIAVLFILFAAYSFITSGGSEEKVKKAKTQLLYAVIAIAIALVSSAVTLVVKDFLSPGASNGSGGSSDNCTITCPDETVLSAPIGSGQCPGDSGYINPCE